ncbi:ribosome biogenesis protein BOP1 homolog isoform X3 [Acipenser ruthenus]|uniref:ribosome biogenesis protein BOP1 homolog isoform X3 n=1 Tax=Acipenser ruthenus TaxID=7906 RepID=UPI0027403DDD|nr:ribosome biogenesis protein BOP1 homolog isoform X3 [Acipenser ruthenus]
MKLQPALFLVFAVVGLKTAIAFSVESEDLNESDGNSKRDEMDFDEQSTEDDHGMEDFDLDSEENTERDSDEESQRENMSEDEAEDLNSEEKAQRENLEADELGGLDALLENLENVADQQDSKETIQ